VQKYLRKRRGKLRLGKAMEKGEKRIGKTMVEKKGGD